MELYIETVINIPHRSVGVSHKNLDVAITFGEILEMKLCSIREWSKNSQTSKKGR